jgi:hypothetical protein
MGELTMKQSIYCQHPAGAECDHCRDGNALDVAIEKCVRDFVADSRNQHLASIIAGYMQQRDIEVEPGGRND